MSREADLTDLERAWQDARAREDAKKDKRTSGRQAVTVQPQIRKPVLDYRRFSSDEEAEEIRKTLQLPIRRKTIHIQPKAVQVDTQARRGEFSKFIYQAGKIGSSWSKWINEARPGGWRNLDANLPTNWAVFMNRAGSYEDQDCSRLVAQVATGMGLQGDLIRRGLVSDDNKISYIINSIDSRKHLLIGFGEIPLSSLSGQAMPAGGFFVTSVAHLSELEVDSSRLQLLRDCLNEQYQQVGQLGLKDTCIAVANWMIKV